MVDDKSDLPKNETDPMKIMENLILMEISKSVFKAATHTMYEFDEDEFEKNRKKVNEHINALMNETDNDDVALEHIYAIVVLVAPRDMPFGEIIYGPNAKETINSRLQSTVAHIKTKGNLTKQ